MAQWDPGRKGEGSNSLYGAMMNRIASAGGKITGVLWYQGESDANPDAVSVYKEKMKNLVASIRSDLNAPDLPFYYVQIGRYVVPNPSDPWDAIQEAQRQLASEIANTEVVPSVDLELDDLIHADTAGLATLGRRLANVAGMNLFKNVDRYKNIKRGPRIKTIAFDGNRKTVRIECSDVNGKLRSRGRVSGFSVSATDGAQLHPYKATIDPARPSSIVLLFQNYLPEGAQLWYGRGLDPYCNVTDEENMGLPAMGPMPIQ
jgi:sialate O-acetylesterase